MKKIVAIHQPNYIPWIGFFDKVAKSDIFVFLDTAAFTKNSIIHRNKIRTKKDWKWLTIPISKKFVDQPINQVEIEDRKWWMSHWYQIVDNYSQATYFEKHKKFFEELYRTKDPSTLAQLNQKIILYLFEQFNIHPKILFASELDLPDDIHKTELNLEITKCVGGDVYLSGQGAKKYLDENKFKDDKIGLKYHVFKHPVYEQVYSPFIPEMSAIDLLFNEEGKIGGF